MADKFLNVTITGYKSIDEALQDFPQTFQKRALRPALREGGKLVESDARNRLVEQGAVDTGNLLKSIKVGAIKRSRKKIGVQIAARGSDPAGRGTDTRAGGLPFYAWWVEYGTQHSADYRFLRPALWENEDMIRSVFFREAKRQIPIIAEKYRQKNAKENARNK